MEKKYIVIVVIVVVFWAAFMGYRHLNRQAGHQAHHEETYGRMVDMAKKSPNAGLVQMGRALNKFFKDNRKYPAKLDELYPKYISSRAFIGEINWDYEPGPDNFTLTKTGVYNNREMVASMDKFLRPELETGLAVARRPTPPAKKPVRRAASAEKPEEVVIEVADLEIVDEVKMTGAETNVFMAAVGNDVEKTIAAPSTALGVQREISRVVTGMPSIMETDEIAEFVSNLERFLVWKDMNGFIGISNIQFPDTDDMYVAITDRWYSVKRRQPKRDITTVKDLTTERNEAGGVEQVAKDLTREYLVWRDDSGAIGIGNIQYPEAEKLKIVSGGEWNSLVRAPFSQKSSAVKSESKAGKKAAADEIAAGLSEVYLVWKDESGVLGIGNVQYPDRQKLMVASNENWQVINREAPQQVQKASLRTPAAQAEPSMQMNQPYLMWKDKDGHIGYGNVQYPEMRNISYIHGEGNWEKVIN